MRRAYNKPNFCVRGHFKTGIVVLYTCVYMCIQCLYKIHTHAHTYIQLNDVVNAGSPETINSTGKGEHNKAGKNNLLRFYNVRESTCQVYIYIYLHGTIAICDFYVRIATGEAGAQQTIKINIKEKEKITVRKKENVKS